jgi:hypothetical protein
MDIKNLRGEPGGIYVNDTAVHTGQWTCAIVIVAATVSAITQPLFDNTAAITGLVLPQGFVIYGSIHSIQLSAGTIQLMQDDGKRLRG